MSDGQASRATPLLTAAMTLAACGLVVGAAWASGSGGTMILGSLALAALVISALVSTEFALCAVAVWVLAGERLSTLGLVPHAVQWLPDVVILALLVRAMGVCLSNPSALRRLGLPGIAVLSLIGICVLSAVSNGFGVAAVIVGVRYYSRFLGLMLALQVIRPSVMTLRRVARLIVGLAILQVPATVLEFAMSGKTADTNSGTLPLHGGQELLFFVLIVAAALVSSPFHGRKRFAGLVGAASMVIPPILAGARGVIIMGPLMLASLAVEAASRRQVQVGLRVVAVAVVCVLGLLALTLAPGGQAIVASGTMESLSEIVAYESGSQAGYYGRFSAIEYAWGEVRGSTRSALLGNGPGATGQSIVARGTLTDSLPVGVLRNQIGRSLLEVGLAGVIGTLIVLASVWRRGPHLSKGYGIVSGINNAHHVNIVMFAFMMFYFAIWINSAAGFVFWFFVYVARSTLWEESPQRHEARRREIRAAGP